MTPRDENATTELLDPTRFQLMDIGWVDEEADRPGALPRDERPAEPDAEQPEKIAA